MTWAERPMVTLSLRVSLEKNTTDTLYFGVHRPSGLGDCTKHCIIGPFLGIDQRTSRP